MVRVGIIGAGMIAQREHIPGYLKCGAKVLAVADPWEERLKEVAERFKIPNAYTDWRKVVQRKEVDAVSVCTPNVTHAEITIAAAKAGKHVLVEKPMATSMAEVDAMIAAAEKAKVHLMVEQTVRFYPECEAAKDLLESGLLGKIQSVRGRVSHGGPEYWSPTGKWFMQKKHAFGGTLCDLAIHGIDLIRWLVGEAIVEVAGFHALLEKKGADVEDNAVFIYKFAGGAMGTMETSWTTRPEDTCCYIYCQNGNLKLTLWQEEETAVAQPMVVEVERPAGSFVPSVPKESRLGGPYAYFVHCIETGEKPFVSGEEGGASLEVILAAYESARTGKVVRLPLPRKKAAEAARPRRKRR